MNTKCENCHQNLTLLNRDLTSNLCGQCARKERRRKAAETAKLKRLRYDGSIIDADEEVKSHHKSPSIFLSYRRSDSLDATGRIYDRLVSRFGANAVFRDIDSIPLGVPFPELLRQSFSNTDAVLVIIGPSWLTVRSEDGSRRIDDPDDFVRLVVELALRSNKPIIPVSISHAMIPNGSELPESIAPLAFQNGMAVRPDPDFHHDMDRLVSKLEETLGIRANASHSANNINLQVAFLRLENELMRIDQEWVGQRERYQLSYGKNSPLQDPTLLGSVLSVLGVIVAVTFFSFWIGGPSSMSNLGNLNGRTNNFPPFWIVIVVILLITTTWQIFKYLAFREARERYLRKRLACKSKYDKLSMDLSRASESSSIRYLDP